MVGEALIYTTGKSGDTVAEGLWPYSITSYGAAYVTRDTSQSWTELYTVESGSTIVVSYQQDLANTEWDTSTESVSIGFAEGKSSDSLTISSKHEWDSSDNGALTLDITATTTNSPTPEPTDIPTESPTTDAPTAPTISPDPTPNPTPATPSPTPQPTAPSVSPTEDPTPSPVTTTSTPTSAGTTEEDGVGCSSENGLVTATSSVDDIYIEFEIDCDTDTVNVMIEYSAYNDNWFGIVFADNMIGNALIC